MTTSKPTNEGRSELASGEHPILAFDALRYALNLRSLVWLVEEVGDHVRPRIHGKVTPDSNPKAAPRRAAFFFYANAWRVETTLQISWLWEGTFYCRGREG